MDMNLQAFKEGFVILIVGILVLIIGDLLNHADIATFGLSVGTFGLGWLGGKQTGMATPRVYNLQDPEK